MSFNYKLTQVWILIMCLVPLSSIACALFKSVTPADRASAYAREAQAAQVACKAYQFDRAAGLVTEVPEMARVCASK